MSESVSNVEIEDVLSSIRRLVSEEHRPIPRPEPEVSTGKPTRLVLTPSLLVPDPDTTYHPEDTQEPEAGQSEFRSDPEESGDLAEGQESADMDVPVFKRHSSVQTMPEADNKAEATLDLSAFEQDKSADSDHADAPWKNPDATLFQAAETIHAPESAQSDDDVDPVEDDGWASADVFVDATQDTDIAVDAPDDPDFETALGGGSDPITQEEPLGDEEDPFAEASDTTDTLDDEDTAQEPTSDPEELEAPQEVEYIAESAEPESAAAEFSVDAEIQTDEVEIVDAEFAEVEETEAEFTEAEVVDVEEIETEVEEVEVTDAEEVEAEVEEVEVADAEKVEAEFDEAEMAAVEEAETLPAEPAETDVSEDEYEEAEATGESAVDAVDMAEVRSNLTEGGDPYNTATLSAKIAVLEAKIGRTQDQWEPDGETSDDYGGTTVETIEWRDHEAETAEPASVFNTAANVESPAPVPEDAQDDDGLDVLPDEDTVLDEESLRELVADIVRQELQGALGERITRNVRKLVRREIHRALTAQELD